MDYPEAVYCNLVNLARRSLAWHRERVWNKSDLDPNTEVARPPIECDLKGVSFLNTVGRIVEESQIMGHCVASYAANAVKGGCYLFHVEHKKEKATVEISPDGQIRQVEGIARDTSNAACRYAKKVFGTWLKKWPDKVMSQHINMDIPF